MNAELHFRFAAWSIVVLTAAVVIIMYQHAAHTNALVGLITGGVGGNSGSWSAQSPNNDGTGINPQPAAASTISSNWGWAGASSRASGVWTPLGPDRASSIFSYNPGQAWQ